MHRDKADRMSAHPKHQQRQRCAPLTEFAFLSGLVNIRYRPIFPDGRLGSLLETDDHHGERGRIRNRAKFFLANRRKYLCLHKRINHHLRPPNLGAVLAIISLICSIKEAGR